MIKSTKSQLKLFQNNFDAEAFDNLKLSIQKKIAEAPGLNELMSQLKVTKGVQCVEFADDDDLDNDDFVPGYEESEEDSCDFSVILCYVELDRSRMNTKSKYVEVCFYIVYNDVTQEKWIDAASLAVSNNPQRCGKKICFFDIDTHEPVAWCRDLNRENQD